MKNFSGVCQAAGADKPLRAFFIWITNIVTLTEDPTMAKFILNRPDDYLSLSKKKILGTSLLWLFILIYSYGFSKRFREKIVAGSPLRLSDIVCGYLLRS